MKSFKFNLPIKIKNNQVKIYSKKLKNNKSWLKKMKIKNKHKIENRVCKMKNKLLKEDNWYLNLEGSVKNKLRNCIIANSIKEKKKFKLILVNRLTRKY